MKSNKSDWHQLSCDYLNGKLSGQELKQIEKILETNPHFQEEVEFTGLLRTALLRQAYLANDRFLRELPD